MTTLPRGHAADLALTIPLANQANVAWTLAWAIRHHPNWAISLSRKSELLKRYRRATNPNIRRLATDIIAAPAGGNAA